MTMAMVTAQPRAGRKPDGCDGCREGEGGTCAFENIRMNYMGFALIKIKWKSKSSNTWRDEGGTRVCRRARGKWRMAAKAKAK